MANTKRKLLAAPQSKRYFLVPTDQRLERGAFVVYSLQGQRVDAKESDLAPFEVNAQAAKEFLTDQLGAFISNARRFGIEYMDQLKEWAAVEAEARDQPPPAPDLKHPFFEALRTIFAAGKSPTREEAERADAWARAVKETAKRHGEKPPENLEEFADPLEQLLKELDSEAERGASAERLKELAKRVEASAALATARIRELARELSGPDEAPPGPTEPPPPEPAPAAPGIGKSTVVTNMVAEAAPPPAPGPSDVPKDIVDPGKSNGALESSIIEPASAIAAPPPDRWPGGDAKDVGRKGKSNGTLASIVTEPIAATAAPETPDMVKVPPPRDRLTPAIKPPSAQAARKVKRSVPRDRETAPPDEPRRAEPEAAAPTPSASPRRRLPVLAVMAILVLLGLALAAIPLFHWLLQ